MFLSELSECLKTSFHTHVSCYCFNTLITCMSLVNNPQTGIQLNFKTRLASKSVDYFRLLVELLNIGGIRRFAVFMLILPPRAILSVEFVDSKYCTKTVTFENNYKPPTSFSKFKTTHQTSSYTGGSLHYILSSNKVHRTELCFIFLVHTW